MQPEFSDREALGQAKLGALATYILTRRAGVPVTQMERWAPSASGVDRLGSRDSFGQKTGNLDANAKLIAEVKKWESLVDGLTRKPRQPVLMLTQIWLGRISERFGLTHIFLMECSLGQKSQAPITMNTF